MVNTSVKINVNIYRLERITRRAFQYANKTNSALHIFRYDKLINRLEQEIKNERNTGFVRSFFA